MKMAEFLTNIPAKFYLLIVLIALMAMWATRPDDLVKDSFIAVLGAFLLCLQNKQANQDVTVTNTPSESIPTTETTTKPETH